MSQPVSDPQPNPSAPAPKPMEDTLTMSLEELRALID
ncbi:hypothetical protein HNR67_006683 [Crossiella cryophila]|uniref:Uncharacterized protein n=1 Tax=Crossiella cryophila TaxID=43355 RepID=A0A7W7CGA1_9PSEU|nr:hypothetical protein [Crossiella cryophila]